MLKLAVLLATVAAFVASATLAINPDELHLIWNTIEEDLKVRQNASEQEIRNLFEPLTILVSDAEAKLASDIQEANRGFQQQIKALEEEHPDKDISGCAEIAQIELQLIDKDLVASITSTHAQLEQEAEDELERALNVTADALEQLEMFKRRVDMCLDTRCASELNVEVVAFYENIVKDLDGAIAIANEAVLIKLGAQLDLAQLNQSNYEEDLTRLLEEVKSCIDSTL
ncbi:uncharacterized protein LOC109539939 [Dendroctonus ponderosae]|uniref:Protein TsetseEP domain-containing protein n=1 Tax=Dendroctonus ponderosae TaxID=77166 RepID=U4URE8_DENPD|nr:uncharacterized protein LOC109539939 [Dendroctonus ponderosae]ERL92640.1 hypothetical protein D910_09953 [Dendroctonus ponderosae]KAH1008270.1 hypothetical protein HUJ05_008837 [Dendroctonus ponderosae]